MQNAEAAHKDAMDKIVGDLVQTYAEKTGLEHDDTETILGDMIGDLLHFAVLNGADPSTCVGRSIAYYLGERVEVCQGRSKSDFVGEDPPLEDVLEFTRNAEERARMFAT